MAVRYGAMPFDEAIAFFRQKNKVPAEAWDDIWQNAHNRSFMVAGATKKDLIADFYHAVNKAISEGKSLNWFKTEFETIKSRHGWDHNGKPGWRSQLIYETNIRQAYNAGREQQIQALKATRPYAMYRHGDSETPRVMHLKWNNLVLPVDDPWWQAHTPQNGWGCKCKKFSLSERDLKRLGLTVSKAPDDGTYQWLDKKTGEVHELPKGIDPGFDYTAKTPAELTKQVKAHIEAKPGIKARLPQAIVPSAFSTVKQVTAQKLDALLVQLEPEVQQKLSAFLAAKQTKTLFIKQAEMGKGASSEKIRQDVADYLKVDPWYAPMHYRIRGAKHTGGFTSVGFEHVVVKAHAKQDLAKVNVAQVKSQVGLLIKEAASNNGPRRFVVNNEIVKREWSVGNVLKSDDATDSAALLSTWLHELGHQVHYYAGAPHFLASAQVVSEYGNYNKFERFAEAFAAWALNREALKQWQPELVNWLDNMITTATTSQDKKR